MKSAIITVLLLGIWAIGEASKFPALDNLRPRASPTEQQTAVKELMKRVIGDRSDIIDVVIKPSMGRDGGDAFHLETVGGRLQISGTTGVAASMGFYYLLKELCGCQYTWAGQQLKLPASLPSIPSPGITVPVPDRFRYFQNVCTVSYSFAWYDASAWEKIIDWMALQGINLPLAFTGQEAIFQKVFMDMGFTAEDLGEFFGGPAFLAWARMGNIMGWGGPLPQSWLDDQLAVQKAVLTRMRSLGMIPVLPGFAGFVPRAITRLYPNATVTRSSDWGGFSDQYTGVYHLDFQDPLFRKIGAALLTEMEKQFGLDHIYNADTFNEMRPPSQDTKYLAAAGKAVFQPMIDVDPDAVWLMQGWLFEDTGFWGEEEMKAYLTSVPMGRIVVLDLEAEVRPVYSRSSSFYGQPFIWNMLHNFGGTMALYGDLGTINGGPAQGRAFPNSSMVGLGLTPEGIFQNEVVYEMMMEQAWRPGAVNLTNWISNFTVQRYGVYNSNADKAWQTLKDSVYNVRGYLDFDYAALTIRPHLYGNPPGLWFNPKDEFQAWGQLLQASSSFSQDNVLFKYDLVDVTRDSLQTIAVYLAHNLTLAYDSKSFTEAVVYGRQLVDLLGDMETLLASDVHFLLGNWIAAARGLGHTDAEKDMYEYNARNQLTLWGPRGNIIDYAAKQWSGLLKDYFQPRWQLFVSMVLDALQSGNDFDQSAYVDAVFSKVESPFTINRNKYPTTATGDSFAIAKQLFAKYTPVMEAVSRDGNKFHVTDKTPMRHYPSFQHRRL